MTCPICTHAARTNIEQAIRAQQDASRRGRATSATSYSQIAKQHGLVKDDVVHHRDRCMWTPAVGARSGAAGASGVDAGAQGDGTTQQSTHVTAVNMTRARDAATAEIKKPAKPTWTNRAERAAQDIARNLANTTADFALRDASVRTHASYVHEIAIQIQADKWNGYESVTAKMREWNRDQLYVQLAHRDACAMLRVARGTIEDQREESLARWMSFYRLCVENGSDVALKVAGDALKGYDLAAGIVDKSTRVQVNVMTDPQAQAMLRAVFEVVREDPAMLERLRQRLLELPGAAAGLPAVQVVDVEK